MPSFITLTLLKDSGSATSCAPSFIDSSGIATWYGPGSVLDERVKATLKVSNPPRGGNVARVQGKVVLPIMDTVDTTKKNAECLGTFELVLPKQATETQRKDIRAYIESFVDSSFAVAAATNIESPY